MLVVLVCSTACKKLVQVDPPDDRVVTDIVFSNDSMAKASVNGLYSNIMGQTKYFLNGGMSLFPGLSADELSRSFSLNTEDQFVNNALLSANQLVGNNIWKAAYSYLYQCNLSIEGLERTSRVSAALKQRLLGEVKFVRALCYYYLVNLFGDVPLVITSDADKNAVLPRSPVTEIYTQVITDLQDANAALPDTVVNTRPNKMACQALLARVYLYLSNWAQAENNATAVINSGKYQLAHPDSVFKSSSQETIFQWAPVLPNNNSAEGYIFVPASANTRPTYLVTQQLLDAFELGDARRNSWVKTVTVNTVNYTFPNKYKLNSSTTAPSEYNIVLRLAEQYLIRAEARAQQGNVNDAIVDVNTIRTRAFLLSLSPAISQGECMSVVEREKRIELFAEWGHRWFDLKRWNKANAVLSIVKGISNWQTTDQLYPIPFTDIQNDPNLEQNEGY